MKTILILSTLVLLAFSQKEVPSWPDQWQQEFAQSQEIDKKILKTHGYYYYDWTNQRQNIWRSDCSADIFTRKLFSEKTECSQITNEGSRYIYSKQTDFCCLCDHEGLFPPNWQKIQGGEYIGRRIFGSQLFDVFRSYAIPQRKQFSIDMAYDLYTGIQSYMKSPQIYDKFVAFSQISFKKYIEDSSVFNIPDICQSEHVLRCPGSCSPIPVQYPNLD